MTTWTRSHSRAIIALVTGLIVMMTGVGVSAAASKRTKTTTTTAPVATVARPPVGISIPFWRLANKSDAELGRDLDRVVESGARRVRFDVIWGDTERTKGQFDWSRIDRITEAARIRGLKIVGILTVIPDWARPAGTEWHHGPTTESERTGYANFARLAAARYAGKIDTWELWNEPNWVAFWSPTPSAGDYAALVAAAYPAVKEGNPQALVISGGTGWVSGTVSTPTAKWYEQLYALGANKHFDAVTVHPYFSPTGTVNTAEMALMPTIRSIMDAGGDEHKLIWGTEVGVATGGEAPVHEDQQAALVPQAYDQFALTRNHGPLFWYTLNDYNGTDRESTYGLIRADGTIKPSFGALMAYAALGSAPDTTAPTVALTAPGSGTTISGWAAVSAKATDAGGVRKVEFLIDGVVKASTTVAPYSASIDTTALSKGTHLVSARAYDGAGNAALTAAVEVTVSNNTALGTTSVSSLAALPGSPSTRFDVNMTTSGTLLVDKLIVAVRDSSGANYDTSLGTSVTLSATQTFSGTRSLPAGTYTYRVAYYRAGTWTSLQPVQTVVVP